MQKQKERNPRTADLPIKLRYEEKFAKYANQFVVNQSREELFIDFSSGPIPDPSTGQTMVPIHTRIALSYQGAQRLGDLLIKAVDNHKKRK